MASISFAFASLLVLFVASSATAAASDMSAKRTVVPMLTNSLLVRDQTEYGQARYSDFDGVTACGQNHPDTYSISAAGVPPALYNNVGQQVCGKCVQVTNSDTGSSITVPIIEKCGKGCGDPNSDYGLLLSRRSYSDISPTGDTNAPAFNVQWTYTYNGC